MDGPVYLQIRHGTTNMNRTNEEEEKVSPYSTLTPYPRASMALQNTAKYHLSLSLIVLSKYIITMPLHSADLGFYLLT